MNRWNIPRLVFALLRPLSVALVPVSLVPSAALADVVWSQPPDLHGFKASSELILNWPMWEDVQGIYGIPWGASFELRDDSPTPTRSTAWGRVKTGFR